ncbi:RdgB/HAM1 family non-canonical purine NTP pyrophosphatase [Epidermidibacterium keratini]|uniref:dITP/XTP pyrophosphatase n=1 Tax=Epidermidibacterium keratini TaxID=1891644 RepID=A0A7L4YKU7_9ACTN|nr:RdgB/HAM1 family non-canonical purine NTP pyrophosphatase [Epidermidibacterium keratini]QHB99502.1 RdgB/HAM1 family non-canonical purine NTP pyrophosphatase [Epidermidibacterium keratini]
MRLLLASRNAKKLAELRRIEAFSGVEIIGLDDVAAYPEAPEDGATFEDNALLKAREAVRYTGLAAVADDSGIAVDALNGCPGIFSARWSGRHGDDAANNALLLAQLRDVPESRLTARFVAAAAYADPDGREVVVRGEMPGRLIREPRGEGGFGYDPLFVPDGSDLTAAELAPEQKDAISHRGKALRALAQQIAPYLR